MKKRIEVVECENFITVTDYDILRYLPKIIDKFTDKDMAERHIGSLIEDYHLKLTSEKTIGGTKFQTYESRD